MRNPLAPCAICHRNGLLKQKLLSLKAICGTSQGDIHQLTWHISSKCRYGLWCDELKQYDNECFRIARGITPALVRIAKTHDKRYQECYELCRGDFPTVCRQLEVLHSRKI